MQDSKKIHIFAPVKQNNGAIAQLVEQRTENPCVPGSIPGGTTQKRLQIWKIPETLWFQGFFFPRNPPFLAKLGNSLGLNRGHFLPLKN